MGAGASSRAAAGAPAAAAKYGKESDAYRKLQSEYDKLQVAHKELLDKLAGLDGFDAPSASSDVPAGAKTGPTAPAAAVPSRTASKGHVVSRPKFVSGSERSLEPTVRQESRIKAAIAKHSPALRGRIVAIQGDMQTVRKAFDELAKIEPPTDQIKFKEFATVLIDRLGIGLSEVELGRVWDGLTPEQVGVPREARTLNFDGFSAGLGQITFLRDVMTEWVLQSEPWKIPDEYDYEKSSNDNYGAPLDAGFYGEFVDVREERDYAYHVNYTKERQLWQDKVIKRVVSRTEPQPHPWIVYTCGPAGAGKGFALSWMSQHGYFPLENICHIDPDQFKHAMPEWKSYVSRSVEAAAKLLHRESGYLQEIAQEVAMRNSQNVWIDGTLKHGDYFAKVFREVRRAHPEYKIAIFEVTASEDTVRRRVKQRAEKTGRDVPEEIIQLSLNGVADSLAKLTPLADFVAKIANEETPQLLAYSRIDHTGNWSVIGERFASTLPHPGQFPCSLSPLMLSAMPFTSSKHMLQPGPSEKAMVTATLDLRCCPLHAASPFRGEAHAQLPLSPSFPVNLPSEAREMAGIPQEAQSFAFAYPSPAIPAKEGEATPSPLSDLLSNGGFVYFDTSDVLVGVNAIRSIGYNHAEFTKNRQSQRRLSREQLGSSGHDATLAHTPLMIQFAPPVRLPAKSAEALSADQRLHAVTLPLLFKKGCRYFAFIRPGERLPGMVGLSDGAEAAKEATNAEPPYPPRYGAFCYIFEGGLTSSQNVYFPIASIGR